MRKAPLWFLAFLVVAAPVLAQRQTASVRGEVTAPGGAAVSGAKVTLVGVATGLVRETTTNEAGSYVLADVPPGTYQMTVTQEGFAASVVESVELNVADVRELDVQLNAGSVTEQITVTSPVVTVETIGGEVSSLVTGEQVRELPLNGRNFAQLTLLMPGVSSPENFDTKNKGLMTGSDLSISGGGVTANLWMIDGANNNDVGSNRTILVYPSVDAIEEFKIHRNSYGAEFGGASGGQINLITRGGDNQYKGSVFYFRRDDSWNENHFFLEEAGQDKAKLDRDDYGFTFGGPILRDKLFVFASAEWNDEVRGIVRRANVPTEAERQGDFSQTGGIGCGNVPTDPLTGQPFPGNRIPADRLSPAGLLYLDLYPSPNTGRAPGSCNNWVASVDTPIDWDQRNARLDWNVTDSAQVMLRYTEDSWLNGAPNATSQNGLWGDDPFPAVDSSWDQPGYSIVGQLSNTLGARSVNTFQVSASGNEIVINRGGLDAGLNSQITTAIPYFFPDSGRLIPSGQAPHPTFWGGGGYETLWNIAPWQNAQDLLVFKDDYQVTFGNHWIKGGLLYSDNKKDELFAASAEPVPQFWGAAGVNGWGATTGNILADFLLRDMTWGFGENALNRDINQEWNDYEAYIADSWQVRANMTLDLGLRYSYFKNPVESDNEYASFNPDRFNPAIVSPCNGLMLTPGDNSCAELGFAGSSTGPNRSLVEEDKDNFAPRMGFAWDVFGNGNSALRLGFGQFYQRERLSPWLLFGQNLFNTNINGIRYLDSLEEPCAGCFVTSPAGRPFNGYDIDRETPYTNQWNVTWEQRLGAETTVEVSYVGSRGYHLMRRADINQVPAGDPNGNGILDRLEYVRCGSGDGANPCQAALRPFGTATGDNTINFWRNDGASEYQAIQTQLISRFGRGSQLQVSYTWSDLEANDPLTDSAGSIQPVAITDLSNLDLDWGSAGIDREHVFNTSLVWHAPTFEERGGLFSAIFGDWTLGGIVSYASGVPLTIYTGAIPGTDGGLAGTGYGGNLRPLRVPGQSCKASGGRTEQWLNPRAYTMVGYQLGSTNQMSSRGDCEGPEFFQIDLMFFKNLRFGERFDAQLRFEVFNVSNEENFIFVDTTMDPISVTYDTGDLASATRVVGEQIPLNFGQATATRDPRQIQLGIKFFID